MVIVTNCSKWTGGMSASGDVASSADSHGNTTFNITVSDDQSSADDEGGMAVISDAMMDDINVYVNLLLRGTIAVFGVSTNVINMVVFSKMGIKDSNSVGLMSLSFTDFVVTFLGIIGTACFTWDRFYPDSPIDPVAFEYVTVGWVRDCAYLISVWITTLLSVERCVCVVSPFKVRQIFTRTRSFIAIVVVYVVTIGVHMPVFLTQWLDWAVVECTMADNGSRVVLKEKMILHVSDNRHQIQMYIDIANGAVLPFPSQIIVLISVIWMIFGLQASSKIRKTVVNTDNENVKSDSSSSKLSAKENRLVKVVLSLAIILTVCNVPRFLAVYAKQIFADVNLGKKYNNLYVFLWNISALTQVLNSSVNIFIYMLVNSNYRQKFNEVFLFSGGKKIED